MKPIKLITVAIFTTVFCLAAFIFSTCIFAFLLALVTYAIGLRPPNNVSPELVSSIAVIISFVFLWRLRPKLKFYEWASSLVNLIIKDK